MTETKEPTTAELFALVRAERDPLQHTGQPVQYKQAARALSELERRMGALAKAARRVSNAASPATPDSLADALDELDAALTDAPPVFTLDAVRRAAAEVKRKARATDGLTPDWRGGASRGADELVAVLAHEEPIAPVFTMEEVEREAVAVSNDPDAGMTHGDVLKLESRLAALRR